MLEDKDVCLYFVNRVINDLKERRIDKKILLSFLQLPLLDFLREYTRYEHSRRLLNIAKGSNYSPLEKRLAISLMINIQDLDLNNEIWACFDNENDFSVKIAIIYTVMHKRLLDEEEMKRVLQEIDKNKEFYIEQCNFHYGGTFDDTIRNIEKRLQAEQHQNKRILYIYTLGLMNDKNRKKALEILNNITPLNDFEQKIIEESKRCLINQE